MEIYSAEIALIVLSMGEMLILVYENARMQRETKKSLYILYTLVICSATMEWCGFFLNGAPDSLMLLHRIVKALDFCISPFIGYTFINMLTPNGIWKKLSGIISFSNIALQFIGIFTGSFASIDSQNNYSEGPLYFLYMMLCIATVLFIAAALYTYGSRYRRRNVHSLYMCTLTTLLGILIQEFTGEAARTSNLAIAFATMIVFIHYNEYQQMDEDEIRDRLDEEVHTDPLTGIPNRNAYEEKLKEYDRPPLPSNLAIFSVDVNGLKEANDQEGHRAGDEVLRLSAHIMQTVLQPDGECYRIGGDEFIGVIRLSEGSSDSVENIIARLRECAAATLRHNGKSVSLAIGGAAASEHPEYSLRELAAFADRRMYQDKELYYSQTGHDRRRR